MGKIDGHRLYNQCIIFMHRKYNYFKHIKSAAHMELF